MDLRDRRDMLSSTPSAIAKIEPLWSDFGDFTEPIAILPCSLFLALPVSVFISFSKLWILLWCSLVYVTHHLIFINQYIKKSFIGSRRVSCNSKTIWYSLPCRCTTYKQQLNNFGWFLFNISCKNYQQRILLCNNSGNIHPRSKPDWDLVSSEKQASRRIICSCSGIGAHALKCLDRGQRTRATRCHVAGPWRRSPRWHWRTPWPEPARAPPDKGLHHSTARHCSSSFWHARKVASALNLSFSTLKLSALKQQKLSTLKSEVKAVAPVAAPLNPLAQSL